MSEEFYVVYVASMAIKFRGTKEQCEAWIAEGRREGDCDVMSKVDFERWRES